MSDQFTVDSIGIVGSSGDLGLQLLGQVVWAQGEVNVFDIVESLKPVNSVDRTLNLPRKIKIVNHKSLDDLVAASSVIHWCAPLEELVRLTKNIKNKSLFLHDSVMYNSVKATEKLGERFSFKNVSVVHMLMNEECRVIIAAESVDIDFAVEHIQKLGLSPVVMTAKEQDTIMACTQAPMALLSKLLTKRLEEYKSEGLLTPSANAFLEALHDRNSKWTEVTFKTLLSNPELTPFVESLLLLCGDKADTIESKYE